MSGRRPRLDAERARAALELRLRNAQSMGEPSLSAFFLLAQQLLMEAALRYTGDADDQRGSITVLSWPNYTDDDRAGAGLALLDSAFPTRALVCMWIGHRWMYAPAAIVCPFDEIVRDPAPGEMSTLFQKVVPSDPVDSLELALAVMYAADERSTLEIH